VRNRRYLFYWIVVALIARSFLAERIGKRLGLSLAGWDASAAKAGDTEVDDRQ
jgi:hypothetical protein